MHYPHAFEGQFCASPAVEAPNARKHKPNAPVSSRRQLDVLQKLSREISRLESNPRNPAEPPISSGCSALDDLLPDRGYRSGSVIEYLRSTPACGASTLALAAAAAALRATRGGYLVVVDRASQMTHAAGLQKKPLESLPGDGSYFYPPALVSHGIDLAQVIFVRPQSPADAVWAIDQALRTSAVAAVVSELERIDDRSARRLQLAAEQGRGLALLLRSAAARRQPSWAEVQWLVTPLAPAKRSATVTATVTAAGGEGQPTPTQPRTQPAVRGFQLELARVRGGRAGGVAELEIDALTGQLRSIEQSVSPFAKRGNGHDGTPSKSAMHLASQLAHSASRGRRAEAG